MLVLSKSKTIGKFTYVPSNILPKGLKNVIVKMDSHGCHRLHAIGVHSIRNNPQNENTYLSFFLQTTNTCLH